MIKQFHSMQAYIKDLGNTNQVFISYYTPVLVKHNGIWVSSPKKYSRTTTIQVNRFISENRIRPVEVEHDYFLKVLSILGINRGLA